MRTNHHDDLPRLEPMRHLAPEDDKPRRKQSKPRSKRPWRDKRRRRSRSEPQH